MSCTANQSSPAESILRCNLGTMFVSLELSKRKWLLTLLSPGSDKMSKYSVAGGDVSGATPAHCAAG
jgi:transposase